GPLAARQRLDRRARTLRGEQKILEVSVDVPAHAGHGDGVVAVANRVDDRSLGIELLPLLIEICDLHVGAALDTARIRRQLPDEQAQQRRLTGAVRPDEADSIAADDARREIL